MNEDRLPAENSVRVELDEATGKVGDARTAPTKKNFAEAFSNALARTVADRLRARFPGILPDASGRGVESRAPTPKGPKRLDVNYSTTQLGLALGISIKTFSFRDARSGRYTKNFTARDNEMRAEAEDYHERQPYAVLVGLVFLPLDACEDGEDADWSSFAQAVEIFRWRSGRREPTDKPSLFEKLFLGIYRAEEPRRGEVWFFDVEELPREEACRRPSCGSTGTDSSPSS